MDIWLFDAHRVMGLSRRWSTGNHIILPSSLYLQWFGNYASTKIPSLSKWSSNEDDLECQLNMELDEGHNLSFGGVLEILYLAFASALTGVEYIVVPSSHARPSIKVKDAVIKP